MKTRWLVILPSYTPRLAGPPTPHTWQALLRCLGRPWQSRPGLQLRQSWFRIPQVGTEGRGWEGLQRHQGAA